MNQSLGSQFPIMRLCTPKPPPTPARQARDKNRADEMTANVAESFRTGWWAVRDSNPGGGFPAPGIIEVFLSRRAARQVRDKGE